MNKQKTGLIIFSIGAMLALSMGIIASHSIGKVFRTLTMDEINQTIWRVPGVWFSLWAFSVPIGALLAGIGILLYARAKGLIIWSFGIGIFVIFFLNRYMMHIKGHYPILFGIGGFLILLFFLGILWFWAKKRMELTGPAAIAADLQLVGYVFLLMGMWFTCGAVGGQYFKSLEGTLSNPIDIMIYFVFGWFFLFLSHYRSVKSK